MMKLILNDPSQKVPSVASEPRKGSLLTADYRPANVEMAGALGTTPLCMTSNPSSDSTAAQWKHGTAHGIVGRHHGKGRVAKLALIGALMPLILMLKTPENPGGFPAWMFGGPRNELAVDRWQFYLDRANGPLYGHDCPNAKPSQAVIWNWWRQNVMCGAKAHYNCVRPFSETDFSEDLKSITAPTLVMRGDDDQIVSIADSALLPAKLLKSSALMIY